MSETPSNTAETREISTESRAPPSQKDRMDAFLAALDSRQEMLKTLLGESGIDYARFVEVVRRALIKNPELVKCTAASFVEAAINACTDRLLPDGRQGAIVPFRTNVEKNRSRPPSYVLIATWIPMYQGLLDVAYASGNFRSIECRVVYEGDAFSYDLGDEPFIKHRPKSRAAGTPVPPIVAAYAVAKTVNGGVFREVFEGADIEKVNRVSKSANGPMKNWPEEAARKGPLRRIWKFLPKNEAMNRIIERDNDGFDLEAMDTADQAPAREKRLAPGFAPPAQLTQGADMVLPAAGVDQTADFVPASEASDGIDSENGGRPLSAEASNEAAKSYEVRDATDSEIDRANLAGLEAGESTVAESLAGAADGQDLRAPEVKALQDTLAAATSWLNVKQALKSFAKTELGGDERAERAAKAQAWLKVVELREAGADKTDFVTDPLLFECWLLGSDPEPDHDTVEGNWAIVQADKAFPKLAPEDQERITARVAEALGAD